ncbi:MAG: tetratricopeptide repeat protein, partial [Bacteroidales bacterium]|nr:tetratricopeptide repeat protein [Bacteroidales bacterium]
AEMKPAYADMLLFMGKTWDAMLLYAQVEKDFKQDAVGFYAKLQTAKLSYYVGEFEWALSQLDVLRAATSKLIANDAMELSLLIKENNNADSTYRGLRYVARADALAYRRLYAQALQVLDSVLRMPAETQLRDDVYYKKAQIYMRMDSLEAALTALEHVYRQPAGQPASLWADDALLQAAVCHEALGQPEKAMEACRELFERFPSSLLAPQALESYRRLRQAVGLSSQISGASSACPAACPETSEKSRKNKNS